MELGREAAKHTRGRQHIVVAAHKLTQIFCFPLTEVPPENTLC